MFFNRFPNINYTGISMKDLSVALVIRPAIKENKDLFFYYEVEDGERPETVAFDFYGNTTYEYVVMLMNDLVDPFYDWPLGRAEMQYYCELKYGIPTITSGKYNTDGYYEVKQWEKDGIIYPAEPGTLWQRGTIDSLTLVGESPPTGSLAVSHFDYEERLNDKRRKIKILFPELIPNIQKELDRIFNG